MEMLLLILSGILGLSAGDSSYLASFPNALIPGIPLNVRIFILKSTGDVDVNARLVHAFNSTTVTEANVVAQKGVASNLQLMVPMDLRQSSYKVKMVGSGGLAFINESKIHFENDNLHIFIQTDKSRYSAGQEVKYRALFLLPNLLGYKDDTYISIRDGKNNRVHFDGPLIPKDGVVSGTFTLSREPNFGDWTIIASAKDRQVSKGIKVNDYALPKFSVDINFPSEIKKTDNSFDILIEAKFTFKSDVYGTCTLQIYNTQSTHRFVEYKKQLLGTTNFTIPMTDLRNKLCMDCKITVRALVTDNATLLTMAAEKELKFTTDKTNHIPPITISQTYPQKYFVPGLKYYSTVFIGRGDEPLGYIGTIEVSATITTSEVKPCLLNNPPTKWLDVQTTTLSPIFINFDEYGVAALVLNFPEHTESANILMTYGSVTSTINLRPLSDVHVTMLRIYPDKRSTQPGDKITFTMESTDLLSGPLQIEVFARGTRINQKMVQLNSQKSVQFIVHVREDMVPEMYVLATHVTNNGTMIADEVNFKVQGLPFRNKVNVSFSADLLQPGQMVQMTLTADPNSTVYVLSEDEKNRLLGSDNDVFLYEVRDKIVNDKYSTNENIANYPREKRSLVTKLRRTENQYRSLGDFSDTDDMFIKSGVIVLSDFDIYEVSNAPQTLSQLSNLPRKCFLLTTLSWYPGIVPTPAAGQTYAPNRIPTPAPGQTYAPGTFPSNLQGLAPVDVIRSKFPETWLWAEYKIGPAGKYTVSLSVPDSMTSWVTSVFATNPTSGFGIPEQKPKITVKKPFFVTMDLPDAIILGEEFLLQVTVFNYLNTMQQVFLQITSSDNPKNPIPTATVVKPGHGHSTYVHLTPSVTGSIQIEVVAKAGFFTNSVTDHMVKNVTVLPSGVKKEKNEAHLVSVSTSSIFTQTVLLTEPPKMVTGTKKSKIRITGNFMVPSIDGLQNLIRMPYGCGEQTMLNFAPDIYITKYLKSVGKLTADVEQTAKNYMKSGLQRELTYQHFDGSFSAFGNRDASGSSWLTAFVLKCFRQAEGLISIDEAITTSALSWLLKYQRSNGQFFEPGRIIHTQMQAGTSSGLKLTAFILISILENRQATGVDVNRVNNVVLKGRQYLETQLNNIRDVYTLGIVCYALTKSDSAQKTTCFTKLKRTSSLDGEKMYWVAKSPVAKRSSQQLSPRAASADVEATSYALLAFMEMGKHGEAFPIVKWLVGQRNPRGGFQSTQDTIISLQALAIYSSIVTSPPSSYSVNFNIYSGSFHDSHSITSSTVDIVHELQLPDSSQNVLLQGLGNGVAVIDVIMTYYVEGNQANNKLGLNATITKESLNSVTVQVCIRWKDVASSGMLVAEVETPTGFAADNDKLKTQSLIKRYESNGRKLALYFDGLRPQQKICVDVKMDRQDPVVKSQACHITVYDYYEPTNQATVRYESGLLKGTNICDVCPLCSFCTGSIGPGSIGVGR